MYAHSNNAFSRAADLLGHFSSPPNAATQSTLPSSPSPMHYSTSSQYHHPLPDQLALSEFDLLHETLSQLNSEVSYNNNNSCSSGYSSYGGSSPSSLASYGTQRPSCLMQRSVSSHSLHKNSGAHQHPVSALFAELLDSETGPVRRVYSTGDLQSESPLSSESSMIIEGMSRACRYSPEEKKVRIERYRSKRNQRNFNKKIKYACRKTLADSRPRIRGRFARNDEIDKNPPVQWSHIGAGEEEDEDDENWGSFFDSLVAANLVPGPQGNSSFGLLY